MGYLHKNNYIAIHILLWILFGFSLLFYIPLNWRFALPYQFWIKQGAILLLLIAVYYVNAYVLVPRFLLKNKAGWFILIMAGIIFLSLFIIRQTELLLQLTPITYKTSIAGGVRPPPFMHGRFLDPFIIMMILLVTGISTSITSILKWQRDDKKRQLLEQEKTSSELAFLKAQINPHFFFNTLNNIYALTHIDVETSRTALHKLSRLMRYLLYDIQHDSTSLSKEIVFINDYIELMKLRITDNVTIRFESPSLKSDPAIAPMLLLPFIENAFKHGISAVSPGSILIFLSATESLIQLKITNTIFKEHQGSIETGNRIGLSNTMRRLNLLYPEKHTLLIKEDNDHNTFTVSLKLQTI